MFREVFKPEEKVVMSFRAKSDFREAIPLGRASLLVKHSRPQDFTKDPLTGLYTVPVLRSYKEVDEAELVWNQITNAGRDYMHVQCYGAAVATATFQWIALTNTAITPAAGDTTLSGEIATNGLARAQGTYAHTAAAGAATTSTIDKTFTATGTQSAQAGALFTASSAGTMNHELTFTQRNLISGDTLQTTWTLTL